MEDATHSAEKAIAYDKAGKYDAAIYFYVVSFSSFYLFSGDCFFCFMNFAYIDCFMFCAIDSLLILRKYRLDIL